jgi:hypothetical protein
LCTLLSSQGSDAPDPTSRCSSGQLHKPITPFRFAQTELNWRKTTEIIAS